MILFSGVELAGLLPSATTRWGTASAGHGRNPALLFGIAEDGERVGLPLPTSEGRHAVILGETGMGKSTVLVELARAAAEVANVVLFDPVGDTGRRFLSNLSPGELSRVLWISPTDSPVALDILGALRGSGVGSAPAERALSEVVDALRRVRASRFGETPFWGPRIEETVRRALAATAAIPGARLEDAVRLLEGVGRRPTGVPPEAQEMVQDLWDRAHERPEEVEGSRRLLAEITERPVLRALLGAREPRCSVDELLRPHGLTVVTADAGAIGENSARYLMAVLLALLWSDRLGDPRPSKTVLLLDEAQWYAHESVAEILRLGRRSNLHLVLATQALASLSEEVRDAVRTNAADLVLFRGSPDDARDVGRWSGAVEPEQLMALPAGHGILLLGKGGEFRPFRIPRRRPRSREEQVDAERRAAESSRDRWAPAGDRPSTSPPETPPFDREPTGEAVGPVRKVLLTLRSAALETPSADRIRIGLDALREAADPVGNGVREAGRRLRQAGFLVDAGHDARGSWWELRADGLAGMLEPAATPAELREAAERWRAARR